MSRKIKKYLYDIHYSAQVINRYAAGKTEEDYLADEGLRDQIERRLIIICEAMRGLDRTHPEVSSRFTNYRGIMGLRAFLVNIYYQINNKSIWKTVQDDLPLLEEEAERLLQESD